MDSWMLLKKEGAKCFKMKDYQKSCDHYKEALTNIFETKFDENKHEFKLNVEASKITSNISLMYYKLSKETDKEALLEESKTYAKKTIKYTPNWIKGYLRLLDACKEINNDFEDVLEAIHGYLQADKDEVLNEDFKTLLANIKYYTHKTVMKLSPSWHLVKYQNNVCVIDSLGAGHFKDFEEFLNYYGTSVQRISVLVRPGIYVGTYVLNNAIIDIVGDCNIEINPTTKAIENDPTVIFTNTLEPMTLDEWRFYRHRKGKSPSNNNVDSDCSFYFKDCKVSLKRISVYEKVIHHPIHAISCENTDIKIVECSFVSKFSASLGFIKSCKLNCQRCRSVGSYTGVLTGDNTYAKLTDCFISETAGMGIEARDDTEMIILKHCTITKCKKQGLVVYSGAKCAKVLDSCFEGNCSALTVNEGSMQFINCRVLVKNSSVKNQNSNGIVIEGGSGNFDNVVIKNCVSGIQVQANVEITNCSVSNCTAAGISMCTFIKGAVVLDNNTITKCMFEVGRFDTSPMPIFKGQKRHVIKTLGSMEVKAFSETLYTNLRNSRSKKAPRGVNIGPVGDVLGVNEKAGCFVQPASATACRYCGYSEFQLKGKSKTLRACSECKMVYYCSPECQQKAWKLHKPFCEADKKTKLSLKINMKESHTTSINEVKKTDFNETEENDIIGKYAAELGITIETTDVKSDEIEASAIGATALPEWKRKNK